MESAASTPLTTLLSYFPSLSKPSSGATESMTAAIADKAMNNPAALAVGTSAVAFVSGLLLGIYTTRGYLISPEFAEERRRNLTDPFESEFSDVEDDVILDHAPNWTNGDEADARDGLRASHHKSGRPASISGASISSSSSGKKKKKSSSVVGSSSKDKDKEKARHGSSHSDDEEYKMVLVVRTDLGMTKGRFSFSATALAGY